MILLSKLRQHFRSNNILHVREIPKVVVSSDIDARFEEARAKMNQMGIYDQKPLIKVSRNRRLRISESEVSPVVLSENE